MKSCNCINTSICFNYQGIGITYCTLTNASNGLGWAKISNKIFDGEKINWSKFFEERDKEIDAIKNGTPRKECENCPEIKENEFVDDKKIHYILLSPWQICNSNCIYCLGHEKPISKFSFNYKEYYKKYIEPYNMLEIIKDMIKNDVLVKDAKIDFAGGEPTLYPRFNDILNFLIDNGFTNIIIHTNNIKYSKVIEKGIKANVVSLMISIDAGTKKCHKEVKGIKSYDKVWKNFNKYAKVKPDNYTKELCTKYVLVPNINDSESELEEFVRKSKENGATKIALNVYNQLLNEMNYKEELLTHLADLSDFMITKARENDIGFNLFPNIRFVYKKLGRKRI